MTLNEKQLLRISYSNNDLLLQLDDKLEFLNCEYEDLEKAYIKKDLKFLFDVQKVAAFSVIVVILLKPLTKLTTTDKLIMYGGINISYLIYNLNRNRKDKEDNRKQVLEKYDIQENDNSIFDRYSNIRSEIKTLLSIREKVVTREIEIRDVLEGKEKTFINSRI